MTGFVKKGFGKGGNTLILLAVFFVIGFVLHLKDRIFPDNRVWDRIEKVLEGEVSGRLGELARASGDLSASVLPLPSGNGPIEELLLRPDFVIPTNKSKEKLQLVAHKGFSLGYAERFEQAAWVAYALTREQVAGQGSRERFFNPDPKVKTGSSLFSDYTHSGYDRGHLAPAADFKSSTEQMKETFYMSNISPQNREFNAGIWNDLEKLVRVWAGRYEKIYVVTGPVLQSGLPTIGKVNKVAVPKQFYKVILYANPPHFKAIAFLMDNEPSTRPLRDFVVSIDSVEQLTGLNFFPLLPEEISAKVESKSNPADWYRMK